MAKCTIAADEPAPENPLNWQFVRYDLPAIRSHNVLLGDVAYLLENAFHATTAMESISQILIADAIEIGKAVDGDGQPLSDCLRAGLLTATHVLSSDLHNKLCVMATKLEKAVAQAAKEGTQ